MLILGIVLTVVGAMGVNRARAETSSDALNILTDNGIRGGLVVHVGCDDGERTAELRADDAYLVHGLDTSDEDVQQARQYVQSLGLYGKVTIDRFDGRQLPYVDNLVNLIVVDKQGELSTDEILRVLAPRGVAILGDKKLVKAVPDEVDEWTHHMYDASGIGVGDDRAVSRPRSMQWKAGPEYSRSHENMSSVSAMVSATGRVFSIMDEGPKASIYLPSRWSLAARDAYSGVLLWKQPIERWHAQLYPLKSGPLQLPRRLVAVDDRVYVTLGIDAPVSELDAATGRVLRVFEGTDHAEEILHLGDRLIVVANSENAASPFRGKTPVSRHGLVLDEQTLNFGGGRSVVLIDLQAGRVDWKTPVQPIVTTTISADNGRAVYIQGDQLVCLDLDRGEESWSAKVTRQPVKSSNAVNPTVLIHDGIVFAAIGGNLTAFDAAMGDRLWSRPCAKAGYRAQATIFVIDGLIWDIDTGGEPYRPGTKLDVINRYYVGYDLRTGEERRRLPIGSEHGYAIMHHRCHVPRASGTNIITSFPGIEFFDVTTGKSTHDSWIRGACLYGFMPAGGMLYTPPHPCACYMQGKLSGFWAVAGEREIDDAAFAVERLEKGAAQDRATVGAKSAVDDWPTYRGNAARSGTTCTAISTKLARKWHAEVGSDLSQCVIAAGKLFVTDVDSHTVHALDASNGSRLWNFTAGGRVDSAPTVYGATVIFGSRDGYVYCLTADRGEVVWRFRAAPADRRVVVYDQVESVWPVHGSVLLHDDILWCCAGRSSFIDGGLYLYRLNPRTGELLSTTRIDTLGSEVKQPPITPTIHDRLDMAGAKNDILSCDGAHVFMRHWACDMKGTPVEQEIDHLFSPTGYLDTTWFRRTYWIFGRRYVGGAQGWARTGNVNPTGRIMSLDEDRIYGFGRNQYPPSPGNQHQMYLVGEKEIFFAVERKVPEKKGFLWTKPGDIQTRGMVLAGRGDEKRLFVAGAKGDWVTSQDAYEGKLGNVLRVMSPEDGEILARYELPALPVFDGMSAADGKLYVSLADGSILALGAE